MKKTTLLIAIAISMLWSFNGNAQTQTMGRIRFSSSGGNNPLMSASIGNPFGTSRPISITTVAQVPEIVEQISVFPNPSLNELNIQISGAKDGQKYTARLFDITGRELITKSLMSNTSPLATTDILPGIYILNITKDGLTISNTKIIKQ